MTSLDTWIVVRLRGAQLLPDSEPVVLVVTDGEPTAHLTRDGYAEFSWPPLPESHDAFAALCDRSSDLPDAKVMLERVKRGRIAL